jgi:hypothetical protein
MPELDDVRQKQVQAADRRLVRLLFLYRCGSGPRPVVRGIRRPVSRVLSTPPTAGRRRMAIPLGHLLPGASRDRPGRTARKPACSARAEPSSLLGLAPGGVCRAAAVTGGAVRSYRTLSPSPAGHGRRATGPRRADCSLWHFPWGRPRRALPGTVFPWSPDFPPPGRPGSGHPAA